MGGGQRVFQHNANFREFPPLPPLLPPLFGAYKSGSAEVRATFTDLSLGSKLHGVYGRDNCRTCILVILVGST